MGNRGSAKTFLVLIIFILLGVIGYLTKDYLPIGFTDIARLNDTPNIFEGQQVKVKGTVVDTFKMPIFDSKSYVIDDGTGEVTILTNLDLPEKGTKVVIIAIGSNSANIGGKSIGFRLREVKVLPETAFLIEEWTKLTK